MLLQRLMGHVAVASLDAEEADKLRRQVLADSSTTNNNSRSSTRDTSRSNGNGKNSSSSSSSSGGATSSSSSGVSQGGSPTSSGESGHHNPRDCLLDLDLWTDTGFPTAVAVAVMACVKGVKRAHLVDARLDGGMLLELYSRDGVGTMISTDFYEGIRRATSRDLEAIQVRAKQSSPCVLGTATLFRERVIHILLVRERLLVLIITCDSLFLQGYGSRAILMEVGVENQSGQLAHYTLRRRASDGWKRRRKADAVRRSLVLCYASKS